ncbi:unnamed protein product [Clonostachys rosea f. rosea IK726]|uniref:Uncharacterized protein n=1 Tax=Clonostachys rosea f. rosea IK726 TaxID=1349383 RepID=A0ACA9UAH5_BIOOC|nr:unnamed protein product [Clonostachys rosea f. rosea IK726]
MAQDIGNLGHQAEVLDAAMVSFLNEPFDFGSINWGTVEWDSSDLSDLMINAGIVQVFNSIETDAPRFRVELNGSSCDKA